MMTSTVTAPPWFQRVSVSAGAHMPLAWLSRQQATGVRVYWQARDRSLEVAGIGAAHRIVGPTAVAQAQALAAQGDEGLRLFGGVRFDATHRGDGSWDGFPDACFVVPEIELVRDADGVRFVANIPDGVNVADVNARLVRMAAQASGEVGGDWQVGDWQVGEPRARQDVPDRPGWDRIMQSALLAMDACEIEKIVLARRTALTFGRAVDALALLARLRDVTPDCFHFCMQFSEAATFIGASPERFYRRCGRLLETEAVAGTRPRGKSAEADCRLGDELLASAKERHEHLCVRDMIREVLASVGTAVRVDPAPILLRLARGQHLFSGLAATLHDGVSDADLFDKLHPTPAVGGAPTPSAMARIRAWEPFDRGWYAAPVGWISRDASEFAVAIRSALCRDKALLLYSGAGIVPGSSASGEWDEIEHKIQDFAGILDDAAGRDT